MHEVFEHTADLGLRIRAGSLGELFAEAGRALMGVLVEDPAAGDAGAAESISLAAATPADLLFDWMSELLYLFSTRGLVVREYDVRAERGSLAATVRGWRFDPDRHAGAHEVKAITYHGLRAEPSGDGWIAEVILDI